MREWLSKLKDPSRDVYERRYRLLSANSIILLLVWLVVSALVDANPVKLGFFAFCDLLFIPTMIYTLRTGKVQLGAGASGIFLVFVMLPFAFFNNGGTGAGAPNWCILAMVFITATIRGSLCTFLVISDVLVTALCYALAYINPSLVATSTMQSTYVDSLASLAITVIQVGSMFMFQIYMSQQERNRLEAQQNEIVELNRAQNRFFSSMSHEIRTPVNTLVGLNEMILREDISDEVAEDARQVRTAGKLLLHLVGDILDMSKLEGGRMELVNAPYNVGDVLSAVVGMLWIQARDKGLAFKVDIDPELPARLIGDEIRIRQILINLLSNAIKYTTEGSVTLQAQGRPLDDGTTMLTFLVTDTGMGIRKEDIPHLFSAFRRVDEGEVHRIEGTGLGLSIVKQLVDLMGGTITVNSVYTKGSTFRVELPQAIVGPELVGKLDLESRHAEGSQANYHASFEAPVARVLVVDDNQANLMVVTKLLRDTKMTFDMAHDGTEALQKTLAHSYDLIFMDHLMPKMDGIECLHRLRNQPGGLSRETPVVALTANAGSESRELYAREGFDAYLVKPCSGSDLERVCIQLLPQDLVHIVHADDEIVSQSISWMTAHTRREELVVTTDSVADLPASFLRARNVAVIPHAVRTPEGIFLDGKEIESSGVVAYMERGGSDVQAEAPSVAAYEAFFAEQLQRANHVLHVSISGGIDGSGYQRALEASKAFDHVTIVDSGHLSSGHGLMALKACELAKAGYTPDQIAQDLEAHQASVHTSFVVDNLAYLERADLVSARVSNLFTALMLHPVLRLRGGRIHVGGMHMGSSATSWRRYVRSELRHPAKIDTSLLFVTYVGLEQRDLDEIASLVRQALPFEQVIFQKASPAIAVNCGPGTFGLIYQLRSK